MVYPLGRGMRAAPLRTIDRDSHPGLGVDLDYPPRRVAVLRDTRTLVAGHDDALVAWDLQANLRVWDGPPAGAAGLQQLAPGPDGSSWLELAGDLSLHLRTTSGDATLMVQPSHSTAPERLELTAGGHLRVGWGKLGLERSVRLRADTDTLAGTFRQDSVSPCGFVRGTVEDWSLPHGACDGEITQVAFAARAAVAAVGCRFERGGEIRLFSVERRDLPPLATLRALPDGAGAYALGSEGDIELFGDAGGIRQHARCTVGDDDLPFEVCEDRYVRPGMLAQLLSGP
jgi:hypothetical protein